MSIRWFVNIFTHRPPSKAKVVIDVVICVLVVALMTIFLVFGDDTLKKCSFWTLIVLSMFLINLFTHLVHRYKAFNGNIFTA
jgi:purine-cytosine permease-like protein